MQTGLLPSSGCRLPAAPATCTCPVFRRQVSVNTSLTRASSRQHHVQTHAAAAADSRQQRQRPPADETAACEGAATEGSRPRDTIGRGKPSVRRSLDGALYSARAAAVQQLVRVEHEDAYAGRVAGRIKAIRSGWRSGSDERDARFVKTLVAGVTRWRRRLDFILNELTSGRVSQLDPVQLQILRVALYELVEMGSPSHIVNEHVDLVKVLVFPQAAGFTNGVLRSAVRRQDAGTLPAPALPATLPAALNAAQLEALAIATSHPTWMVAKWAARYGPAETMALLQANNREPAHGVRVCSPALRADVPGFCASMAAEGVAMVDSALLPGEFLRVEGGLQHLLARHVTENADCQIQDEAAGLVVALLDPQPGEDVLDACAAPGGKTLFAATRMQGRGRLLALDRSEHKLRALMAMARQQGYGHMIRTQTEDLREFAQRQRQRQAESAAAAASEPPQTAHPGAASALAGALAPHFAAEDAQAKQQRQAQEQQRPPPAAFDRVLVDVPCSGLGVLAKRADMRWRRQPADLDELSQLQGELLDSAAVLVRPGGLLVYSTCSIEPEENQQQVATFLARHPHFAAEAPPASAGIPAHVLTREGFVATLPHRDGVDGAFAARLRCSG